MIELFDFPEKIIRRTIMPLMIYYLFDLEIVCVFRKSTNTAEENPIRPNLTMQNYVAKK